MDREASFHLPLPGFRAEPNRYLPGALLDAHGAGGALLCSERDAWHPPPIPGVARWLRDAWAQRYPVQEPPPSVGCALFLWTGVIPQEVPLSVLCVSELLCPFLLSKEALTNPIDTSHSMHEEPDVRSFLWGRGRAPAPPDS